MVASIVVFLALASSCVQAQPAVGTALNCTVFDAVTEQDVSLILTRKAM